MARPIIKIILSTKRDGGNSSILIMCNQLLYSEATQVFLSLDETEKCVTIFVTYHYFTFSFYRSSIVNITININPCIRLTRQTGLNYGISKYNTRPNPLMECKRVKCIQARLNSFSRE